MAFPYGSLRNDAEKAEMYGGLRAMGTVLGTEGRAEEVIAYIEATIADLENRTGDIPEAEQKAVYGVPVTVGSTTASPSSSPWRRRRSPAFGERVREGCLPAPGPSQVLYKPLRAPPIRRGPG